MNHTCSLFATQHCESPRSVIVVPTAVTGCAARGAQAVQQCEHRLCSTVLTLRPHRPTRAAALPAASRICLFHPKAASHSSRMRMREPELKSASSAFSACDKLLRSLEPLRMSSLIILARPKACRAACAAFFNYLRSVVACSEIIFRFLY